MRRIFRILIIASVVSYLLFVFLPYIEVSNLDEFELNFLSWDGYGEWFKMPDWFWWLSVAAWVLVAAGIYVFNSTARTIYFLMVIAFLAITPFSGMRAFTAIDQFLFEVTTMLDGALLAIAYLTSVNDEFASRPNKRLQIDAAMPRD